jgi:phosphoserine phosphatase
MTLVAFDFDGTLSDSEMTVLLGDQCGVADQMDDITARAMNNEIEYAESLRQRCALLDGLSEDAARDAFDQVVLRPETEAVTDALDSAGVYTAVLTGGFERGVESALETAGVDVGTLIANRLPVEDGELTGNVEGPLIEGPKDDALDILTTVVEEPIAETIAVGDGANDLPMLEAAGFAVGFAPKAAVEPTCDVVVESMSELLDVLEERGVC